MPQMKTGFNTTTKAIIKDDGKEATARALEAANAVIVHDDGTEHDVADAIVKYIMADTDEKVAKESKDKWGILLRTFANAVRDHNALKGDYQKTLRLMGKVIKGTQYAVDASHVDKWTPPKSKQDLEALKALLGTHFDTIFEPTVDISIKKSVMENDSLRKELSMALFKALGAEGIKKFFDKEETYKVKKGMAEEQFRLTAEVRNALRTGVKQAGDMLKDASEAQ